MEMDKRNRKKKTVDDTVCEIHRFSGYAVLSNCFVRSTTLGCPAICLLGRVMDLPSTWIFISINNGQFFKVLSVILLYFPYIK